MSDIYCLVHCYIGEEGGGSREESPRLRAGRPDHRFHKATCIKNVKGLLIIRTMPGFTGAETVREGQAARAPSPIFSVS